jgi:spore maturation protein CgeB
MRFVIFTHSLVSDWNHGNAHFLRGVATELVARGEDVVIFEPVNGWSLQNLLETEGSSAVSGFSERYPELRSTFYDSSDVDLDHALRDADVVVVHEWNPQDLVARIGRHQARHGNYQLFFHDTHHRILTDSESIAKYDLTNYDGVLAFGNVIRDAYLDSGRVRNAWTWHEAADTRVFHPLDSKRKDGDVVWIGNWGDDERADSIREFLVEPVRKLGISAHVYGVRYPDSALEELEQAGIQFRGWLPNYRVPETFSRYRMTVHIPRKPYVRALPGIPTIRVFEALACGIPLISAPWEDCENLFRSTDFLYAHDGREMTEYMSLLVQNPDKGREIAEAGLETIRERHTCAHRVDELLSILTQPTALAMTTPMATENS